MRRLSPTQAVVLDLEEEAIECVVASVAGDEATLTPVTAADAAYIPSLGRAAALVVGGGAGGARARIEGAVQRAADAGRLRFVAGLGAGLPARRQTARAGVELTVAITVPGASSEPRRLLTSDVSLGGLGVRLEGWRPDQGDLLDIAIEIPDAAPIRGTARVLRIANGVAGLAFTDIAPVDRGRLAAFLIASRATHRL